MFKRSLQFSQANSFFLFGARGTGKTTLLQSKYSASDSLYINLLDRETFQLLEQNPNGLASLAKPAIAQGKWILLDEIQKIPALLDVVHDLIESEGALFGITGSSARKLRRGAANLLAGRAFVNRIFPLTPKELAESFDLGFYLNWGGLPKVHTLDSDVDRKQFLITYADLYLNEEIVAEQIIRKLPPFRRFLQVAAQSHGNIVNCASIARDVGSDPNSVKSYYQILDDTLLGFHLDPFHFSVRKRQRQSPKFYIVDPGIARAQAGYLDVPLRKSTFEYGRYFEGFIISTIRASLEYQLSQYQLSYLKTKDNAEIDLIVERAGRPTVLIEIKSGDRVDDESLANLNNFRRDIPNSVAYCVYNGNLKRKVGEVTVINWQECLEEIGVVV